MAITVTYIQAISEKYPTVLVQSSGDGSVYENLVWVSGDALPSQETLDADCLEMVKQQMWKSIQVDRDLRKFSGVKVGDYWFHTDNSSRIQYLGLVMMGASMPSGIMWKTMTGDFVAMAPELALGVFMQVATQDMQTFGIAEAHHANMLASSDPGNYDFYSVAVVPMWPLVYTDVYPNAIIF
jgi:hypothetical protein